MSKYNKAKGQVLMNSGNLRRKVMMKRQLIVYLLATFFFLQGCSSGGAFIPVYSVGDRSKGKVQNHLVRKGDTLYSIAFRYGLDYKILAKSNGISRPFTIYAGQSIRLNNRSYKRTAKTVVKKQRQKTATKPPVKKAPLPSSSKSQYAKLNWQWPVPGKLLKGFSLTGKVNKGVDIQGKLGDSVHNAADGVVVYAGGGLRGYGKLVIVKHNDHFLSAYGHNRAILVKEGEKVKGGQKVAEIGSSETNLGMLHFEIRKDGKPEDPLIYLPNRNGKL
ncbi:MAG: lipoprotein NlpD [Flavobacterium sp.]|jgi:lipoprotein NlpD